MRADILACYPALDAGRVHVIRNGIDTRQYAPDHGTDVLYVNDGGKYVLQDAATRAGILWVTFLPAGVAEGVA